MEKDNSENNDSQDDDNDNNNDNNNDGIPSSDPEEMNEDEEQLIPPRPELENVETQVIKLLKASEDGPKHPRTVYFINDPDLNQNKKIEGITTENYEIKEKKFMVLYKAYKNLPLCLSGPMKFNQVIRSKLFENTNVIWKLLKIEKMSPLLKKLNKYQRFNHFPMTWQLSRKDNLYLNYMKMKEKFPSDYNYMPETYILPKDKEIIDEKIKEYNLFDKDNLFLIKPVASSRGRGVRLLTDVSTLPKKAIVTHYISNPHLINKKKYDLRLYLLITGYCPLKIYLYDNGLSRFCSEPFDLDPDKMNNRYIHLTNYSINKSSVNFEKNDSTEAEKGSKWTLLALKGYFAEKKLDFNRTWDKIKDIMIKVAISVIDQAIPAIKEYKLTSCNLFELYGVDILLDDRMNPWLMEVNLNPSLNCDSELDLKVKSKLLTDIFNIIGIIPFSHDGKAKPLDKPNYYKGEIDEAVTESLCEFARPTGGFERIFPLKNNIDTYRGFIADPRSENITLWEKMKSSKDE